LNVLPWTDRKGHVVPLKLAVFLVLFVPGLWIAFDWWQGNLAPKPVTEALHATGTWSTRILLLSLLITPLRAILHWPRVIDVRRMVGVGALAYLLIHFCLYIYDQKVDLWRVASEIVLRFYLTIGFVALLGLGILGLTSTDGWVRRLGAERWNRLHRIIYVLTVLSLIHAFLQAKVDVTEWVIMSGLFIALMVWRRLARTGWTGPLALVLLALGASLATALVEAGWYAGKTGVDALRVLAANLDPDLAWRPAQWVLILVLMVVPLRWVGQRRAQGRKWPIGSA
jgi:sulfoxide reductase heme-binding subunit YedZ